MPPVHTLLVQSEATKQLLPGPHFVAHDPPQSTSDSLPFLIPSVQLGAPDAACAEVGADSEEMSGSAITLAKPTRLTASRLDNPAK